MGRDSVLHTRRPGPVMEARRDIRVAVIGGGIAGLVAAHDLGRAGLSVTLLERAHRLGGLAGSFEIDDGQTLEKYYHFICKPDRAYFEMQRALGLDGRLRWATTEMGLFYRGATHTLGDPLSLLRFPYFSPLDKLRFLVSAGRSRLRGPTDWNDLEHVPARAWLVREYGERVYEILYRQLLESKFHESLDDVSAAWMWARLYRLGNSRTLTQKERIGYLEGGSQAYVDALEAALRRLGVEVRTGVAVDEVVAENGRATGVRCGGETWPFDWIISTVPIPHTAQLFSSFQGKYFEDLKRLKYIGVMVMLLRIKKRFSRYFWMNVSDRKIDFSGVIEYTNLNPCRSLGGDSLLYIPQYLDERDLMYNMSKRELLERYCRSLQVINPAFDPSWVKQHWIHRDRFAQPVCQVGFSRVVPAMQTPIPNLFLTDSYQLHPHDRSISDSTALGLRSAKLVIDSVCGERAVASGGAEGTVVPDLVLSGGR